MYVGEPDELSAWMVRHGVRVHHWPELSFMREGLDRYASCACPSGSTCDPKPHCRAGYFREFVLGGRLNVLASAAQRGRSLGRSKLSANATYDRSWERPGAEAAVRSTTSGIPGAGALYTSYPL